MIKNIIVYCFYLYYFHPLYVSLSISMQTTVLIVLL